MSVSDLFVRALVEAVERGGASRRELLGQVTGAYERLDSVGGRFELSEFASLLERSRRSHGRPSARPPHGGADERERLRDAIAYLVGHAPTLREAVAIAVQFGPLVIEGAFAMMRDSSDLTTIQCALPRMTPAFDRFLAELSMAGFLRITKHLAGGRVMPRAVSFEHDRPPYHRDYVRAFGDVVRFSQNSIFISFDRDVADRSQLHRSPELYSVVRADAERKLDRLTQGSGPTELLRQYVLARSLARVPDVATAACDLGMSERALRRHLAAENTSYREIVRSTREASARHMLRDPRRTIQETAAALGFVDARSFHRAFKAWTRMTPTQYRKNLGGQ